MSPPTAKLSTGQELPLIGLGTFLSKPGEVGKAVTHAVENCGYRHIDCANAYLNEDEIGDALTDLFNRGVVKREDIFLTSKLNNSYHRKEHVRDMCVKTLKDLNLKYLDLYLVHWPFAFKFVPYDKERRGFDASYDPNMQHLPVAERFDDVPLRETWEAMEALVEEGLVKAIGVSNFTCALIQDLLSYAKIKPAVNQIELHPFLQQEALVRYCKSKGIVVEAYSPLGTPGVKQSNEPTVLDDALLKELAAKYSRSTAQIALRWQTQRGVVALPKSVTPSRIQENIGALDFELSEEDMEKVNKSDRKYRFLNPDKWFNVPLFD